MLTGGSPDRDRPLNIIMMAIALIVAAFAGAALGKIWHSTIGDGAQASAAGKPEPATDQPDTD